MVFRFDGPAPAFIPFMAVAALCALTGYSKAFAARHRPSDYFNTATGVGYVGSKVCAHCHTEIYRKYLRTAMGRSMTLASDPSLPRPQAPVRIHNAQLDRDYEIFCRGYNLYQSESETGPDGSKVFYDVHRIAYALGAGENGIGYLVKEGNYLVEAPLSYYAQAHTWELSPGYELGDLGFDRLAPVACVVCHSGRAEPVPGREGLYKSLPFKELAVGCENCHGPGQLHVQERTQGTPVLGARDRSIVNPADLPSWLANNICMMCHERGDARVLQRGKTYLDFRPGTPLDRTVAIFAIPFNPQSPPRSPLLQQYVQMTLSKCYRLSGGKLACITCHDPHLEPTIGEAPAYYRRKCLKCHAVQSCGVALAERRQKSPPDDCIGCHMPRQNLQGISHSALTNHRIVAYPGEPFPDAAFHMTTPGLKDLVYLDQEPGKANSQIDPLILLQAYRDLLQQHPEYRASESRLLDELAKTQPDNPQVLSALGERAMLAGTPEGFAEAQKDLSQAIAEGSTSASDFDLYARLLIHSGAMAEAVKVLKRDIALYPYLTERYKMLAFAYLTLHQQNLALQTMKQELRLFPQDSEMRKLTAHIESSMAFSPPSRLRSPAIR